MTAAAVGAFSHTMLDVTLAQLFSAPTDPSLLTYGIYSPGLVALSVLVAIFSSWMGLQMAGAAAAAQVRVLRITALLTGSLALGSGVWAMHFIGMLAFDLCTRVDYDPAITIASMLPSVGASFVALSLTGRKRIGARQLSLGGVLVGAGIGAMHYTGMAAMQMQLAQRYDPWMFALSIVVAVVLATLALWVRFGLIALQHRLNPAWRLLLAATVMGCAIAGMHYTGMAAARFVGEVPAGVRGSSNTTFLALAVSLITVAFTVFVMAANGWLRYRAMFRQLSQSASWMRTLLATAVDGVVTIDAQGVIQEFNAAAERIFGWKRSEVVGRNMTLLIADPEQSGQGGLMGYLENFRRSGRDTVAGVDGEGLGRHKDGRVIPLRRALGHGRLGEQDLFVCFITDISERRQREEDLREAKERAEQAAAARAAFLANMSHEIRTPMNSILGFTDILLHDDLTPEQRRHLDVVRTAGRSLLRLLNEILDSAKLDKGAMELDLADFDLVALIDELSSTLGAELRRKQLTIAIACGQDVPRHVHGDELRLRQILTNLLGNALKFTETGGITLAVALEDGQLHFRVQDTGIGIAPNRLESIFEPFTQADASMSRRFGGTGLGTTISKQLVELMGGRIWAESTLGQGSTFHVLLPLAAARQALPSATHPQRMAALPPLRILAVDDVPQNLELLTLLLGKQGHSVVCAGGGAVALELLAETRFDLVLMDIQMPGMNGLDTTRRIRADEAARAAARLPVIAMTASVLEEDRAATRGAGMDGFASKPVDPVLLSHEMARVLGLAVADAPVAETPATAGTAVLDVAQGLRRWGDQDAYHHALQTFATAQGGSVGALAQLLQAQDLPGAQALAHKVKGVAANIGLTPLAAALGALEQACAALDRAAAERGLADLPAQMDGALGAIATALAGTTAAAATASPPAAALDTAQLQGWGTTLMRALQRGSMDTAALEQLGAALAGDAGYAAVLQALDDFDFTLAQTRLAALLAAHGASAT